MIKNTVVRALVLGALLVSGCATLSEDECRHADWYIIGLEDGSAGLPESHLGQHRQACAEYAVRPNVQRYREGREEGLRSYCTAARGYSEGESGRAYAGVCRGNNEGVFLNAYHQGRVRFELRQELGEVQQKIRRHESVLQRIDTDIQQLEQELVADETAEQRRRDILDEVRRLERDRGQRQSLLAHLRVRQGVLEAELAHH